MASQRESLMPACKDNEERLNLTWGRGNTLVFSSVKNGAEISSKLSGLKEIKWDTSLYHPLPRKLVNESSGIFLNLQRNSEASNNPMTKPQLVKISRMYRSVITACVGNLESASDITMNEEEHIALTLQSQSFRKMELIWNLCEILFIEIQPGGALLLQLLDWIKWHFPKCENLTQDVHDSETPQKHNSYWPAINGYVLQGRMDEARKLLQLHSDYQTEEFLSLDELLKKMPFYHVLSNQSLADFELKWRHWQEECSRRLREGEYIANKKLETICRLLCGDRTAFEEMIDLCETWYHMLVSYYLFTNPSVKGYELHVEAEKCIDMYAGKKPLDSLDDILLAVLQFDIVQVIKESSLYFDSWWFVAHLTDLIHHCKQINIEEKSGGVSLRESLLQDYASCLMSHHSLWQIGVDYLEYCPVYGRQYLEHFLERIPIDTEWKAKKVLHIAETQNMQDLVRSISKIVGMQAYQNGCLGSALTWALKSKDPSLTSFLADKFLTEYCNKGKFSSLDLLDNLGSSMLVSDRLTFLGKYREFHKLYENEEFKTAATLLVSLISSRLAPRYFWTTLLLDALPLLETDDITFSSEQTYELLYCLEELEKHKDIKKLQNSVTVQGEVDKERDLIRLALARNLARAFLNEQSME